MSGTDDPHIDLTAVLHNAARLAALKRTELPDTDPEPSFDRLTRLTSKFLGTPVALVSLVDAERQFFKSCVGLPEPWAGRRETPLSHSFCQHVVASGKPLVIEDARLDDRVKENLAIADLGVIAYLGIPLIIDGHVIGSFCAIDGKPRKWTDDDIAMLTDLTESVVTEIYLRADRREIARQRHRHQVTLSSIGDAVIAADAEGAITFLNPIAEKLCGWTESEALGKSLETVFRIVSEETRRTVENPIAEVLAEGRVVSLAAHTLLIARDGTEWPIDDSAACIRNAEGDVEGVVLVFREISERRRSEIELQDARSRLANALSAGLIATWTWNIPKDRVVADPNLAKLFSVSPEDAAGGPLSSYIKAIHPDDYDRVARVIGETVAHGVHFDEEYRIVQSETSIRWVVARGMVERDAEGRPITLSGVVVDITERKQAADQLLKSEERYQNLYNSIDAGFFAARMIYDERGKPVNYRFLAVNPAFEKQTKWLNVVGRTVREFAPELETRWFETFETIVQSGRPMRFENNVEALESRYFDVYGYRIGSREQHTVGILFNDITQRKLAEAERESLVEQLRDADRRKDEFLAMLAHELRNPLGVISNGVELVKTVGKPEVLTQIRELIQHQVLHLTHLIDDLLDVSRITQGKIELRKQTVDLFTIVDRALEAVKTIVAEKHHDLTVSLPERSVRFVADATRTEQILGNLLTNAAKYSQPRGSIRLSAAVEGEQVVFRVRDRGDGISAEMLPKIFGLFTQVDATIDRSRGGLGIGLTLVQNLVEMHGGTVTAASEGKGKGSEFTVRLPIGEPVAEEIPSPARKPRKPKAGGKVLIVDDNVETVKLTARLLIHQGFQVETAHDGHAAVEMARTFHPTVVLLDIGLPGLNGYEVAALLRKDDCCKDARLIAISGYGEEQSRERSRQSGFDHHLTKPVNFHQLTEILASTSTAEV